MPPLLEQDLRYSVLWANPDEHEENDRVLKDRGVKRAVGFEPLEKHGWTIVSLPPGIAKKDADWLAAHPRVRFIEPESFGQGVPIVYMNNGSGAEVRNPWFQNFVNAWQAWTKSRGAGARGAIFDNGLSPHSHVDSHIIESKLFRLTATDGVSGGSHGLPVTSLAVDIAPDAGLTNFKIADSSTVRCSWTDVANGFAYAMDQGYKVFNLSYIGGSSFVLIDMMIKCAAKEIAIIVAAGNDSGPTGFPANNVNACAVSAVGPTGVICGFSSRGKINISAPGENLECAVPGGGWNMFTGTSGAAPIVFAIVLLVLSQHPTWTGKQALDHVLKYAIKKDPVEHYGVGWVNAYMAVFDSLVPPPPPPTEPPPPPPEPPPVTTEKTDLTKYAQISCSPGAHEAGGEGLAKLTDRQSNTKCLWFNKAATVTFLFSARCAVSELMVMSANDYGVERDPKDIRVFVDDVLVFESFGNVWPARFQSKTFVIPPIAGTKVQVQFMSSGLPSPGDKGQGICQVGEAALLGVVSDVEAPPPAPVLSQDFIDLMAQVDQHIRNLAADQKPLAKPYFDEFLKLLQ